MITLKIKVGKGTLEYQGNDMKDVHRYSSMYGMLPSVCDNCQSDDVYLSHKAPQGNDYYLIACKKCGAELTFHQKKEGGFYIVKGERMEIYKPNNQASNISPEHQQNVDIVQQQFQQTPY